MLPVTSMALVVCCADTATPCTESISSGVSIGSLVWPQAVVVKISKMATAERNLVMKALSRANVIMSIFMFVNEQELVILRV
jgi:hypothetical protein